MGAMFAPPQAPAVQPAPPVPGPDTAEVLAASREAEHRRAQARGRASTYLTDPSTELDSEPSAKRLLTGDAA